MERRRGGPQEKPAALLRHAASRPEPAGVIYTPPGTIIRRHIGQVTAIGGRALRTNQGHPIRYVGDDIVIDRPDGSQEIYCGREGRVDAIRNGILAGVR